MIEKAGMELFVPYPLSFYYAMLFTDIFTAFVFFISIAFSVNKV